MKVVFVPVMFIFDSKAHLGLFYTEEGLQRRGRAAAAPRAAAHAEQREQRLVVAARRDPGALGRAAGWHRRSLQEGGESGESGARSDKSEGRSGGFGHGKRSDGG